MRSRATWLIVLLVASCLAAGAQPNSSRIRRPAPGIEELTRLDHLALLKRSIEVGMVSSYDRTGGNDDGFSGKYSFLRKEAGGLVIADLQGPGVIYRIHTPTPTDDPIEFYFDGEPSPRLQLKFSQLFDGTRPPFLPPLVGAGSGGRYAYVPITYRQSCKIVVKAEKVQFYDINFARFPSGERLESYSDAPAPAWLSALDEARRLFATTPGSDISHHLVPAGTRIDTVTTSGALAPGKPLTLFRSAIPGRVVGIRLGPASALAGKARDIVLRAYWDDNAQPAVECPVGDFFGASFGEPAVQSLLLGTTPGTDTDYIYLPMPFARSARIELISERPGAPVQVTAEVAAAPLGKDADEGRFYCRWQRENPTSDGVPFTYLETSGRGHVVGVLLQAQGLEPGGTEFFEGDDRAVLDGALAIPGTGSEDSFNGGWYDVPGRWEARRSYPFSGCLDYKKPLGRTGGYRFMLGDAYAYRASIDYTIEHGPERNRIPADYTAVTFFYSLEPPAPVPLRPAAARRVSDPARIVFVPGWNVPVRTFSLQGTTLTKQHIPVGSSHVRVLSVRTTGDDDFSSPHVELVCDLPAPGRYKVGVKAVLGPDQGIVRVFRDDVPSGGPANLYAADRAVSGLLPLGVFELTAGDNSLFLHLTGKDAKSTGTNMDLVEIVFEKM
jgi:hypothetical protein